MKIFVTGGTGYLGSWLVKKLSEEGHEVLLLVRNPAKASHLNFKGIQLVPGDLLEPEKWQAALSGADQVYHLAAFARAWSNEEKIYEKTNIAGTRNILDACLIHGIKKVVITSSAGNYGPSVSGVVTESTERRLPFFTEYERTKNRADLLTQEYIAKGLPAVIVYPTRIFGPFLSGEPVSVTLLMQKIVLQKFRFIPGDGNKMANYVYVHDVLKGLLGAMERGMVGEKYILGGHNVSYNHFYREVALHSNIRMRFWHIPFGWIRVLVKFMGLGSYLGAKPAFGSDWLGKIAYNWEVSSAKAEQNIGYRITGFSESVRETVQWIQNKNKRK